MARFIYVDEAGTSPQDDLCVYVALIVHADNQVFETERIINETFRLIPKEFREGFVFSAKSVWGNQKYRESWSMNRRLQFLYLMMGLRKRLGIPLAYCVKRKIGIEENLVKGGKKITPDQFHKMSAFSLCLCEADRCIREVYGVNETGAVIAENNPDMENCMKLGLKLHKEMDIQFQDEHLNPTKKEIAQGYIEQRGAAHIERIRNSIFFAKKDDDPILFLADACAYGLRRCFMNQRFGYEMGKRVFGREFDINEYANPMSFGLRM